MKALRAMCAASLLAAWPLSILAGQWVDFRVQGWISAAGGSDPPTGHASIAESVGLIPTLSLAGQGGSLAGLDMELALRAGAALDGFLGSGESGIRSFWKPHRLWARYKGENFDLRLGIQKLAFGPALFLRPVAWFDTIDLRDPTGNTSGVNALRVRYFPSGNLALWGWVIASPLLEDPSPGGRAEINIGSGELAFTYHYRRASSHDYASSPLLSPLGDEERVAVDVRIDWVLGLWAEVAGVRTVEPQFMMPDESLLAMVGGDYTLDWGSGLYLMAEHLSTRVVVPDPTSEMTRQVSVALVSFPLSITDQLMGIVGYDWQAERSFTFLQWQRSYDYMSLHMIIFTSPGGSGGVAQDQGGSSEALATFSSGAQIMIVANY